MIPVSRVAAVLVVLALAAGQAGSLLCKTWCRPPAVAASDCAHQTSDPSPRMTGSHGCADVVLDATVVREDLLRALSISIAHNAVVAVPYQPGQTTAVTEPDGNAAQRRTLRHRSLAIALRL